MTDKTTPTAPAALTDTFMGDDARLVTSIESLLALDAARARPRVGGHARSLLMSAAVRLSATPAAQAGNEGQGLTTCNCRWRGEKLVQQCELHEAWRDAIHDWAERAKDAEKKLALIATTPASTQAPVPAQGTVAKPPTPNRNDRDHWPAWIDENPVLFAKSVREFLADHPAEQWDCRISMFAYCIRLTATAKAPAPSQQAEPAGWAHENDDTRVISAAQKAQALRDGGASASSVAPYSIKLLAAAPAQPEAPPVKPLDDPRLQELFSTTIDGALTSGYQGVAPAPAGHWLEYWWNKGRAVAEAPQPQGEAYAVRVVWGKRGPVPVMWDAEWMQSIYTSGVVNLYAAPQPSPDRLAMVEKGALKDLLTDVIAAGLHGTYHCTRVWDAWGVGTMSEDDFEPVDESNTPADLADAVIAALDRPTQSPKEGV